MQIPKKILNMCFWFKKNIMQNCKEGKKISRSHNQGVAKDFCVTRDGPKSSCESHDTGMGITYFDE